MICDDCNVHNSLDGCHSLRPLRKANPDHSKENNHLCHVLDTEVRIKVHPGGNSDVSALLSCMGSGRQRRWVVDNIPMGKLAELLSRFDETSNSTDLYICRSILDSCRYLMTHRCRWKEGAALRWMSWATQLSPRKPGIQGCAREKEGSRRSTQGGVTSPSLPPSPTPPLLRMTRPRSASLLGS